MRKASSVDDGEDDANLAEYKKVTDTKITAGKQARKRRFGR